MGLAQAEPIFLDRNLRRTFPPLSRREASVKRETSVIRLGDFLQFGATFGVIGVSIFQSLLTKNFGRLEKVPGMAQSVNLFGHLYKIWATVFSKTSGHTEGNTTPFSCPRLNEPL